MNATDMANRITELEQLVEGLRAGVGEARREGFDEGIDEAKRIIHARMKLALEALSDLSINEDALALMERHMDREDMLRNSILGSMGVISRSFEKALEDLSEASVEPEPF